jgi:hypothetical protein
VPDVSGVPGVPVVVVVCPGRAPVPGAPAVPPPAGPDVRFAAAAGVVVLAGCRLAFAAPFDADLGAVFADDFLAALGALLAAGRLAVLLDLAAFTAGRAAFAVDFPAAFAAGRVPFAAGRAAFDADFPAAFALAFGAGRAAFFAPLFLALAAPFALPFTADFPATLLAAPLCPPGTEPLISLVSHYSRESRPSLPEYHT